MHYMHQFIIFGVFCLACSFHSFLSIFLFRQTFPDVAVAWDGGWFYYIFYITQGICVYNPLFVGNYVVWFFETRVLGVMRRETGCSALEASFHFLC
jgi:hypothetical protein